MIYRELSDMAIWDRQENAGLGKGPNPKVLEGQGTGSSGWGLSCLLMSSLHLLVVFFLLLLLLLF